MTIAHQPFGRVLLAITAVGLVGMILLIAGRRLEPMLYEVSSRDPYTIAVVALTMLPAAIAAAVLPPARATRTDPRQAVRAD